MNAPTLCAYGRVTRKGANETKTAAGNPVVRLTISVPVERRRRAEPGEEQERTTPWWITCLVFNEGDRRGAKELRHGDYVWVVGRVSRSPWTDKEGRRREEWTLMVDAIKGMLPMSRYPLSLDEPHEQTEPPAGVPETAEELPPPEVTGEYEAEQEPARQVGA